MEISCSSSNGRGEREIHEFIDKEGEKRREKDRMTEIETKREKKVESDSD